MDILRRYDRESTTAIHNVLNLPECILCTIRKNWEKITAAFKAGVGSRSTRVSSGQSTIRARTEKMLVTWMDHRKHQGLNVTFDDPKKKAMECFNHLKQKETGSVPEFNASTGWFYKFKSHYGFHNKRSGEAKSADEEAAASYPDRLRAIIEEWGHKPHSRFLTWMKWACSRRRCLNAHTSRGRRSLPLASKCSRTISPCCWELT